MTYHLRVFNSMATWDFLKITQPYITLCILLAPSSPAGSYALEKVYSKVSVHRSNLSCQVRLLRFSMGNFCRLHFENNSTKPLLQQTLWTASFAVQTNTDIIQKSSTGLYTWYICVCIHSISLNMYDYINVNIYHWCTPLSDFITLKYFPGCVWFSLSCYAEVYVW